MTSSRRHWLIALGSFLLPLSLYLATVCHDIWWMDATEFMLVGRFLALSHPPGYPLLSLVARVFSLLPAFSLPLRFNLISALAAAGSCFFIFRIVRRATGDALASLLAALGWAVSFELWQQATALEAYALQTVIVSGLLCASLAWASAQTGFRPDRDFLLACFAFGLGLANHLFIIWLVPGLLVLLFAGPWRALGPRHWLAGTGLLLLGPLLYLYVPLRSGTSPGWAGIDSLGELISFVTARSYRYRFIAGGAGYLGNQVSGLPALVARQFSLLWLLAIPGVLTLWRRQRRTLGALAIGFTLVVAGAVGYNIPDKEGYFLSAWLICAVVIGVGLAELRRTRLRIIVTAACAGAIAGIFFWFLPRQNRSRLHGLTDLSSAVLAELPDSSILFTADYSLVQGLTWTVTTAPHGNRIIVSEHHLAFPWYLERLRSFLPVPDRTIELSRELWRDRTQTSRADFGESAARWVEQAKADLIAATAAGVYWFPRDFGEIPETWRGHRLRQVGLCYELGVGEDTTLPPDFALYLPAPERYRTTMFRDPETEDLCRRFAATANRRGMLRFARGQSDSALADFTLALRYYPDYSSAVENTGLVLALTGRPDSARPWLERFLRMDPESPEAPKVRAFLARIAVEKESRP